MTDAHRKLIRKINWLLAGVLSLLVVFVVMGALVLLSIKPKVRPADVLKKVQELQNEIRELKPPPEDATNGN